MKGQSLLFGSRSRREKRSHNTRTRTMNVLDQTTELVRTSLHPQEWSFEGVELSTGENRCDRGREPPSGLGHPSKQKERREPTPQNTKTYTWVSGMGTSPSWKEKHNQRSIVTNECRLCPDGVGGRRDDGRPGTHVP